MRKSRWIEPFTLWGGLGIAGYTLAPIIPVSGYLVGALFGTIGVAIAARFEVWPFHDR